MKVNKVLAVKVLEVTARELNAEDDAYTFRVLEFENGLILVPGSSTNDWFFESRQDIEPNGNAVVEGIEETGKTVEWVAKDLLRSVQGSIREFGVDAVPAIHLELWK